MSEILRKSILVLKSNKVLLGIADLMTESIENVITQEDKICDMAYYYRVENFGYRHHYLRYHGYYYPCD